MKKATTCFHVPARRRAQPSWAGVLTLKWRIGLLYAADIGDSSSESEQEAIRTA